MSERAHRMIRLAKVLVVGGLVAWGIASWWTLRQARQAGSALFDTLTTEWPENGSPRLDTREKLLSAAQEFRQGSFGRAAADLGPSGPLSAAQRAAAGRWFDRAKELRKRFLAAATAAQRLDEDGADVGVVREALARALTAAADKDQATATVQIELAERALDEAELGGAAGAGGGDAQAVAALVRRMGPAFNLGQELLTEGHAAVEKLVGRASRHFQANQHRQAASLVRLAAELLGVEPSAPATAVMPKWFDALARSPSPSVPEAQARQVVALAEAMAASETPSKPVQTLLQKARRELEAGRPAEAYWWASVALNALGMSDEAIAAATEPPLPESPE